MKNDRIATTARHTETVGTEISSKSKITFFYLKEDIFNQ